MGYGDFKLFAALGAWLGWKLLPLVILLSAAAGALLGILMIVLRGRDRSAPMPFGPYLAAAGWLGMMYGDTMVNSYLRVSGHKHYSWNGACEAPSQEASLPEKLTLPNKS